MAEGTILTWNVPNWITVVLMVAIGFAVLGFSVRLIQSRSATS